MNGTALMEAEVIRLCKQVGDFQLQHFRQVEAGAISDKGLNQLVSFVDVESEKMLVAGLRHLRPDAGFITEEETAPDEREGHAHWIIDPLDGTTNFLHGLQVYCISVALVGAGNRIELGVVHAPAMGETFSAIRGGGARLNGNPIRVSDVPRLKNSLIATGFPYYEFQKTEQYLRLLGILMRETHGLRRMGSAAIDLAYTACGRFDGFYEMGLNAWDVAAGALIVEEAGGEVSDFSGGTEYLFGKQILASNALLKQEFQQLVCAELC